MQINNNTCGENVTQSYNKPILEIRKSLAQKAFS